jgi:hypothetical protein
MLEIYVNSAMELKRVNNIDEDETQLKMSIYDIISALRDDCAYGYELYCLCEKLSCPIVLTIAHHMYDINLMDAMVEKDDLEIVKTLHECPYYTDGCTADSLMCASARGRLDILKYIFENNIEIKCTDDRMKMNFERLLDYAVLSGDLDVVKYICDRGFMCSHSTIWHAADDGHVEILDFLFTEKYIHCVYSNEFFLDDFKNPKVRAYLSQPQFTEYVYAYTIYQ